MSWKGFLLGGPLGHLVEETLFKKSSDDSMEDRKREKKASGVARGDVICVNRSYYDHFGVYNNSGSVFHYYGETEDDAKIIETDLSFFLQDAQEYQVCVFPDEHGEPVKVSFPRPSFGLVGLPDFLDILKFLKKMRYKIYEPDEVIERARSRLGENRYSLAFNNCEHYAIWCKTGISESHQIEKILKLIRPGFVPVAI